MTKGLPGVFPDIQDGGLGLTAGYGAGRRALIGVCSLGMSNQVYTLTNPSTVESLLGRGPLTDAVITHLSQVGGVVYAVPVAGSLAGVVTPSTDINTDGNVTLDGTPREGLDLLVVIQKPGAPGVAEFVYSLDGGDTVSPAIAVSDSYILPGTGHTLKFATADYLDGAVYHFQVTAPQASMSDLEAAVRVLMAGSLDFEFVHITQAGDAALWTMLDVLAAEAEASFRYPFFIAEAPSPKVAESVDAWVARLLALMKGFSSTSKRVLVVASSGELIDQYGYQQTRNWAATFGARVAMIPVQENPGWVSRGNIRGVLTHAPFVDGPYGKTSTYNNGHALTLETAGYTVAYTQPGLNGYYWTDGRMAVPAESDFSTLPNRRVMDKAVTLVRRALLPGVQETVDPADLEVSLAHRLAKAQAPLNTMRVAREVSGGRVVIPPGQDVLSTRRLIVQVRIVPMGYTREIALDIGFENPALLALITQANSTAQTTATAATAATTAATGTSSSSTSGSSNSGTTGTGGTA